MIDFSRMEAKRHKAPTIQEEDELLDGFIVPDEDCEDLPDVNGDEDLDFDNILELLKNVHCFSMLMKSDLTRQN